MLILSRKANERIRVGEDTYITVIRIGPNAVRLGIDAPRSVEVVRCELEEVKKEQERETV